MSSASQIIKEGKATMVLAVPLIIGQITQMLVMVTDTLMIGHLGVTPLAATTFANTILHLPYIFGIGVGIAVSIRVSQARGANDPQAARAALRHGLYIGLFVGLGTVVLALLMLPFLSFFGQKPEAIEMVPIYFVLVAVSMVPAMGAQAVKNHADAMNRPWPAFWVLFAGVGLNALLNWILIFGKLGAPAMGVEGAGLATLISRLATMVGLIVLCSKSKALKGWVPVHWFRKPDWEAVRHLVKVGLPASLQILAEASAFVIATIVIGTISDVAVACHQVAISCVATIFMIPLGIAMALTVQVGEAWGAGQRERLRPIALSGWLVTMVIAVVGVPIFLYFNETIAGWFIIEPEALEIAAGLLLVAAVFQVSDSMQVVSAGFLRGLDDVVVPARISFLAYWVISLPIGWVLSIPYELGVNGMWFGITFGLTFTAIVLGFRVWRKVQRLTPTDVGGSVRENSSIAGSQQNQAEQVPV